MIAEPPFEAGADQESATWVLPGVAEFSVGALGAVAAGDGVAERLFEAGPVPTEFVAVTVKE